MAETATLVLKLKDLFKTAAREETWAHMVDARLYLLPWLKVGVPGFSESPNTRDEAQVAFSYKSGKCTILASQVMPFDVAGEPVTVGGASAYVSSADGFQFVTWKRGPVVLRVTVEDERLGTSDLLGHAKDLAKSVDDHATRVLSSKNAKRREFALIMG